MSDTASLDVRRPTRRPLRSGSGPDGIGIRLQSASLALSGHRVLRSIDLELAPGSHSLLVGANGSGKSELLKLLAAQRWPTPRGQSSRHYYGADGAAIDVRDILPRLQLVSAGQQDRYERYGWNFTVATVIGTGCRGLVAPLTPLTAAERRIVASSIDLCGLGAFRRRRFLALSYGERRLELIARALAARPVLLLLDEVHNGLDSANRSRIDALIADLCRSPVTLVVAAHRARDAHPDLDGAIAIDSGELAYSGSRARLPAKWRRLVESVRSPAVLPKVRIRSAVNDEPLVRLIGVSAYRDYHRVLNQISWTIDAGQQWAIVGGNGSGKTTLLELLHGLRHPAAGGCLVRRGHHAHDPIEAWQRRVRYSGPDLHNEVRTGVTLLDVALGGLPELRRLGAVASPAQRRAARHALGIAGITTLAGRNTSEASYGELRLALLARCLIGEPEALLLDEPLTGLDAGMRLRMIDALDSARARGIQLVTAIHEMEDMLPCISHVLTLPDARQTTRTANTQYPAPEHP